MFRLMYVSTAREWMSGQGLLDILQVAREKNARLGVTGMLLYKDGNFMQLLEGEASVVQALYDTIARDERHCDPIVMLADTVDERLFADWSMGFRDLSDPDLQAQPGFIPFKDLDLTRQGAARDVATCLEVLRFFRDSR